MGAPDTHPQKAPRVAHAGLSPREMEILKWAKAGKTRWEISVILTLSDETIKSYMKNIFKKLKAANKAQAVAIALERGLITAD